MISTVWIWKTLSVFFIFDFSNTFLLRAVGWTVESLGEIPFVAIFNLILRVLSGICEQTLCCYSSLLNFVVCCAYIFLNIIVSTEIKLISRFSFLVFYISPFILDSVLQYQVLWQLNFSSLLPLETAFILLTSVDCNSVWLKLCFQSAVFDLL